MGLQIDSLIKGKKVIVAGSGVSGMGAVKLLSKLQAEIIVYDGNNKLKKEEVENKLPDGAKAEIVIGELMDDILAKAGLMVVSPGIPLNAPCIKKAEESGICIWGEIELAYQCAKGKLAAITGTNGKTTTTALTGEMLKSYYNSAFVVGNIGIPYTSVALDTTQASVTVAEISSFQLETIKEFAPHVTAILNITPDHLNRHKTLEGYIAVKESIAKNQRVGDICVLNYEDEELRRFGEGLFLEVVFFSSKRRLERGIYQEDGMIVWRTEHDTIPIVKVSELSIVGNHNVENVMAATAIAAVMGVPIENIRRTARAFQGVEHRVEFVRNKEDVLYYNDSKGTNPDASIQAIRAMTRPTLLIGGGYDKQSEFDSYIDAFQGKIRYLVLLGATRDKIARTARDKGFTDIIMVDTLKEAVEVCAARAMPGDAVLLSPACASWDMFQSYEERGRLFKEYVNGL